MSILIKDIHLPDTYGSATLTVYECIEGRSIPRAYKITADQMRELPPHGRLVDADNLVQVIDDEFTEVTRTFQNPIELFRKSLLCGFAKDVITAAPTIIEAEEGEGHE